LELEEEADANHFAACLLMPKGEIVKLMKEFSGSVEDLAEYF